MASLESLYIHKRKTLKKLRNTEAKIRKIHNKSRILTRKERARNLLLLGILMEKAKIDSYDIYTLLGYFLEFKSIDSLKILEFSKNGKEILSKKAPKEAEVETMTRLQRKERAHHLISIGALLETAKIHETSRETLAGFFKELHLKTDMQLQRYYELGFVELKKRKAKGRESYEGK